MPYYCRKCKKVVKQVVGSGLECPICETTLSVMVAKPKVKLVPEPKPKDGKKES